MSGAASEATCQGPMVRIGTKTLGGVETGIWGGIAYAGQRPVTGWNGKRVPRCSFGGGLRMYAL